MDESTAPSDENQTQIRQSHVCWFAWGATAVYLAIVITVTMSLPDMYQPLRVVLVTAGGSMVAVSAIISASVWQAHRANRELRESLAQRERTVDRLLADHRDQFAQILAEHNRETIKAVTSAVLAVLSGEATVSDIKSR